MAHTDLYVKLKKKLADNGILIKFWVENNYTFREGFQKETIMAQFYGNNPMTDEVKRPIVKYLGE